jgi:hypothetical protein
MSVKGIINVEKFCKDNDVKVVLPEPRQLQLDIDSPKLPEGYTEQFHILNQINPVLKEHTTTSKSGNLHVYIDLMNDITPVERVMFQACMGSDIKRELLTYQNLLDSTNERPQFLFEKADGKP